MCLINEYGQLYSLTFNNNNNNNRPIPVAARLLGLWVRIQPGHGYVFSSECCVLSGRSLCDGLITRPEESYRERGMSESGREAAIMRRP